VSQQPDLAADTGLESNTPSAKSEADAEQTNPRDAEAQGNGKRGFKTFTRLHVAKWLRLTTLAGVGLLGIYGSITLARLGLSDMDSPQTDKQSQPCLTQPGQGPEMVLIRGGTFEMGSNESTDETPVHQVSVKDFAIGRCEVTFDEYDRFAEATKREKPDDWGFGRGNRPVIAVSWEDARAYADWLSQQTGKQYRLPTEAEWEYAARASTTTQYWWGDEIRQDQRVWANCNGCGSEWDSKETAPVGSFPANPFGLLDTAGNVWEWVEDCWHENYQDAPQDGSAWLEANGGKCEGRVVRGGSWGVIPRWLRSADRLGYRPTDRDDVLGFRLVQDLPQ
jgi:formylglycine-generating enzyme required for sulfatase activity